MILLCGTEMGVKTVTELVAFRTAREFKFNVYAVVKRSQAANDDRRYRSQVYEAAASVESNIAEGFHRFAAGEFRQFLRYALASLAEAELRLNDGVDRGYFSVSDCGLAFEKARSCRALATALFNSLEPFCRTSTQGPGGKVSRPSTRQKD